MPDNSSSITDRIIAFIKRKISQKHRFNLQYENKQWDGLRDIKDLGRYSLLVGYAKFFSSGSRILDLGCGEGILQERFAPGDYGFYCGIDISDVAIANANKKADTKTCFMVGDIGKPDILGTFDVIIYNESIYYLSDPTSSILSLFQHLDPGGIFIISCYNKHGKEHTNLCNSLSKILDLADRTLVTNISGDSWTVHVYKIKSPA